MKTMPRAALLTAALAVLFHITSPPARAHCDSLDGPVVQAAQKALSSGDVNLVHDGVHRHSEPAHAGAGGAR